MNQPTPPAREPLPTKPPAPRPLPFEFSATQERLIASLANLMKIAGGVTVAFGGLLVLAMFQDPRQALVLGIQSTLMIAIGWLTFAAGGYFDRVATTRGEDIPLLMEALARLRTAYMIQVWALVAAVGFLILVILWVTFRVAVR